MSYEQKSELQQFVFPKGTTFEKEKQRVRTPEVNLLFELTKRTTGIYENKKSGILTHNEMDSALVDLSVLSSNFFRELLSKSVLWQRLNQSVFIIYSFF